MKNLAIAYAMKKRAHKVKNEMALKEDDRELGQHGEMEEGPEGHHPGKEDGYAKGGEVDADVDKSHHGLKGINKQHANRSRGTSEAGHYAKYETSSMREGKDDGSKAWLAGETKKKHNETLSEMRAMPKPNLPMAEGGEVDLDMVGRIMKQRECMYSEGGRVANHDEIEAGFEPNEFDDLVLDDGLGFHDTAKNSGDELGNKFDSNHKDMVERIMMKRKKQHNPKPA